MDKAKQHKSLTNNVNFGQDCLILVGRKAIHDAINNSFLLSRIRQVCLSSSQHHLLQLCDQFHLPVLIKPKSWFKQKFSHDNHQNCCLYIKAKKTINLDQLIERTKNKTKSVVLMLDQIQDPHNFGAIIRTAVATNVDAIIISSHNQVKLTTTVLKVSAGSGLLIDIIEVNNLNMALEKLKKAAYWSYATLLDHHAQNFKKIDYAPKSVLIVGNEGNGISHLLSKNTDFKIKIPMNQAVESLNVAVATGILLYQILC
ncbi:23S rRNA (guanosine(2251)-2'-O)-methyltransferase [[Mycoplasma] cavipharyngis]|uniref:23S rRNA (guanosine(2251)-2'-O)-methyltransferase RlmB n=1 Tax=[Mycoplasma] cavipharyngis TaxID=92757 RepID=UPI0037045A56